MEGFGLLSHMRARFRAVLHAAAMERYMALGVEAARAAVAACIRTGCECKDWHCHITGFVPWGCPCSAPTCGRELCAEFGMRECICLCGKPGCGAGLCEYSDDLRSKCFCDDPRCGNSEWMQKWLEAFKPTKLSARGDLAALLRSSTGGVQGTSFDAVSALRRNSIAAVFGLRRELGDPRIAPVAALAAAFRQGDSGVRYLAHATGLDEAISGIIRTGLRMPTLREGEGEDIMGHGIFCSKSIHVLSQFRRRGAPKGAGGTRTRGQRVLLLLLVDLRGCGVETVTDRKYNKWPRKHEEPVGSTAALLARGIAAREHIGKASKHEMCVFDGARVHVVGVATWPRR